MVPTDEVIRLLKLIAERTSHDNPAWVALISAGSAVLGAAVVAVFSYLTGRRSADSQERIEKARLHANLITTERLRWLQDIRTRSSHLFAQMEMQYSHLKRPVTGSAAEIQEKIDAYSMRVMEETNIIYLMLNPDKPDQLAVRKALQDAQRFLLDCFAKKNEGQTAFDDDRYRVLKQTAFDSLTSIGIATWARIKELE
jgi:hypothetical protein